MGMEFDFTLGHYVEQCTKLGIFIDFDGTLSPLARTPELAFIPPETKKVSHFSNFSCMFLNPNIFSNLNANCSDFFISEKPPGTS